MTVLPEQVRQTFNVQTEAFLGGRLNEHWLVQIDGEKLVLRRWTSAHQEAEYERQLRQDIHALGWPVARDVSALVEAEGALWSLAEFLPGEPHLEKNSLAELKLRGRLMAEFHESTRTLRVERRPGWRLPNEVLFDDALETSFEQVSDETVQRLLLWHLYEARRMAQGVAWADVTLQPIHGDFTPWNLLYSGGKLSGLLDCEMSRPEYRISEFSLSWRGQHDEIIHAYHAVLPLSTEEWRMLTPCWWALLLEGAHRNLIADEKVDDWTVRMLVRRSPLMGMEDYPG